MPLSTPPPDVDERAILLLEEDTLGEIRLELLANTLTKIEEAVKGAAHMIPVVGLIEDVSTRCLDNRIHLGRIDLTVNKQNQVVVNGMALALDAKLSSQLFKVGVSTKTNLQGGVVQGRSKHLSTFNDVDVFDRSVNLLSV